MTLKKIKLYSYRILNFMQQNIFKKEKKLLNSVIKNQQHPKKKQNEQNKFNKPQCKN